MRLPNRISSARRGSSIAFSTRAERSFLETDVLIVGGGPAGLATAIRLRQTSESLGLKPTITIVEKGAEIGGHTLSGAVLEPHSFAKLFPDWKEMKEDPPPIHTEATKDKMSFMTETSSWTLPKLKSMSNKGNWIISLSELVRWMGGKAEEMEIDVFSGISAQSLIYGQGKDDCAIKGVVTNDLGLDRNGNPKPNHEPGMEIRAKHTILAEGCHGSLTKKLIDRFQLRRPKAHQTYGIGLKEVWQIPKERHHPGLVEHTLGWPLDPQTYGGSFTYHYGDGLVSIGLVVGLDYRNPWLSPYQEFQKLKTHPTNRRLLEGGQCLAYGARALNEGGYQSVPRRLAVDGAMLVGCSAGFVNVPKIKGIHNAIESGIIAADCIAEELSGGTRKATDLFDARIRDSCIMTELKGVRNVRPSFKRFGVFGGLMYSGLDQMVFRGMVPWTLTHGPAADHQSTMLSKDSPRINYQKADGILTFDILESLSRTGTNHGENQPCHLKLRDPQIPTKVHLSKFGGIESRFCPAAVYEYVEGEGKGGVKEEDSVKFQINAQNCIHCKTCDIKDPSQNIDWTTPEGGGGPKYSMT